MVRHRVPVATDSSSDDSDGEFAPEWGVKTRAPLRRRATAKAPAAESAAIAGHVHNYMRANEIYDQIRRLLAAEGGPGDDSEMVAHLQQKGIVYLIRRQQEDETPCCRPAKIVLTIDREEPCPAPLLPLPVPPRLAPYLPSFTALPDDPTLVFTAHGFTVKRLDGLPGGPCRRCGSTPIVSCTRCDPGCCRCLQPPS